MIAGSESAINFDTELERSSHWIKIAESTNLRRGKLRSTYALIRWPTTLAKSSNSFTKVIVKKASLSK